MANQWLGYRKFLKQLKADIKLSKLNSKWVKRNSHNKTSLNCMCNIDDVYVGIGTYGALNVHQFGVIGTVLRIGNYCSIAENVHFLVAGEHKTEVFSTYPFIEQIIGNQVDNYSKGEIIIEDDVWIGFNAVILSGVKIGKGAVIAAGAVVSSDVEPYSIVGGVPARIIKYRFSKDIIDKLEKIDMAKITDKIVMENIDLLTLPISESNVESVMNKLCIGNEEK